MLIHGGKGDKTTHITQLFSLLANAGYAWFSVNYRDLNDLGEAVRFITCPGRFTIKGPLTMIAEDTGVPLALKLAAGEHVAQVIGFGTSAATSIPSHLNTRVLLFHGDADDESPFAAIQKACAASRNCQMERVPRAIHNVENWHPDQWEWREEFVAALRRGRGGLWEDIVYSRPGGMPLAMDAYLPEGAGPHPAVIIAHGGGWEAGDKSTYISPILGPLARAGYAWFSIDYRLTPYVHNPEQLEDLRNAVRYVRNHASRFRVDPKRIAILGESASGQIVTQIASEPCAGCQVRAVVSFYGVYDFTPWAQDRASKTMLNRIFGAWDMAMLRRYSPIFHAHAGMPPVLLLQGTADELYSGTIAYERTLTENRVPHEMILLKNAPHGMENWTGDPEWLVAIAKIPAWLRQNLN